MNLYFRLIYMLIASFFKEKLPSALSTGSLYFHVLPTDLDLNGHMNNGRYLTIMDIGRMDFVLRVKLAGYVIKNGYIPVLSSAKMRYRIPLMPFEEYELQTRILCWDDKWVFMEQRFIIADGPKAGVAAAIGLIKGSFYDKNTKTTVPTGDIIKAIGHSEDSPAMPDYIQKWQEAEDVLRDAMAHETVMQQD